MFETLMNLVQQNAGQSVINNPAIPNSQNDTVMQTVTSSIMNGLGQQGQSGGLGSLLGMVTGQGGGLGGFDSHPTTQGVQQHVEQDLMSKLGISPQVAMSIAGALVPVVLNKLMHKANDPNDSSIDAGSLMNAFGGGQQGGGLGSMLGGILGGR